jgi:ribosomal protein L37AE/L43A
MGSIITPHCSKCKFPFKQMMVGGGMMDFRESVKIPFSCYDCGTLSVRNIYSPSNKCSNCRKEMVMFGKEVSDVDSKEYQDCVFDWGMGSFGSEGYVLMNENYNCPKCKEMSLKFEPTGMWD